MEEHGPALSHFGRLVEAYYHSSANRPPPALSADGADNDELFGRQQVLQEVLDIYERCKGNRQQASIVVSQTTAEVCDHLRRIGFQVEAAGDGDDPTSVSVAVHHCPEIDAYEAVKNRVRSAYHAKRARQHEADFIGQLAALYELRRIAHTADNDETIFIPDDALTAADSPFPISQVKASLKTFVVKYHKVVPTCRCNYVIVLPPPGLPRLLALLHSSRVSRKYWNNSSGNLMCYSGARP